MCHIIDYYGFIFPLQRDWGASEGKARTQDLAPSLPAVASAKAGTLQPEQMNKWDSFSTERYGRNISYLSSSLWLNS